MRPSGPSIEQLTFRASIAPGILMPHRWVNPIARAPAGWLAGRIMKSTANNEEAYMTIASDLLQRHIETLVDDNAQWQTLIADDILWELAYAPSIGHPAQLSGREEAVRHAIWFVGAVENFRFFELEVYALADPERAVAEVKGEGVIKSTRRMYRQDYVLFLRAAADKIAFLREYFDPVVRLGHLTRRSLVSNPEDNGRAKAFVGQGLIPHLETTLRLDREVSNS